MTANANLNRRANAHADGEAELVKSGAEGGRAQDLARGQRWHAFAGSPGRARQSANAARPREQSALGLAQRSDHPQVEVSRGQGGFVGGEGGYLPDGATEWDRHQSYAPLTSRTYVGTTTQNAGATTLANSRQVGEHPFDADFRNNPGGEKTTLQGATVYLPRDAECTLRVVFAEPGNARALAGEEGKARVVPGEMAGSKKASKSVADVKKLTALAKATSEQCESARERLERAEEKLGEKTGTKRETYAAKVEKAREALQTAELNALLAREMAGAAVEVRRRKIGQI